MYCSYEARKELEDELYREDDEEDSEGSEVNSELEFHLYSQLHYSSKTAEREEQEDGGETELVVTEKKTTDGDGECKDSGQRDRASELQKHLKGDTEVQQMRRKLVKPKKSKADPKGQRASSSLYQEEVIVIDSGTDIITIDEDDTDDGICAAKSVKSHPVPHAKQATLKRKRSPPLVVVADSLSSGSESEESESESESESDGLENWMILGSGKQDGDHSILLNVEGDSDSNADGEEYAQGRWLVSNKDKEAQIYNKDKSRPVRRVSNRYYTDKNVTCRSCNKNGHLSKNCPTPTKVVSCFLCSAPGHRGVQCPKKHCNNCGLPGHVYEDCSERAYWNKKCHRCQMTGHFLDVCPEIWRQYHITIEAGLPKKQQGEHRRLPAYCYNCSRKGHSGYECTQRRMFNGTYPSTPFINHYDVREDIKRREYRTKLKAKELQENGFLSTKKTITIQAPPTPGPPKKRQKANHHNSYHHQPNHEAHQTPKNHTPSHTHIRFSREGPKTIKAIRHKQQGTGSSAKPWQPKRDVPTSRGPPPPGRPASWGFDEADDFPRGAGKTEVKGKKKRIRKNKKKVPIASASQAPGKPKPDRLFRVGPGQEKKKNSQAGWRARNAAKRDREMYPTDENLFIIKQRKRRR